jgi:hypothetical protein
MIWQMTLWLWFIKGLIVASNCRHYAMRLVNAARIRGSLPRTHPASEVAFADTLDCMYVLLLKSMAVKPGLEQECI